MNTPKRISRMLDIARHNPRAIMTDLAGMTNGGITATWHEHGRQKLQAGHPVGCQCKGRKGKRA